MQQFNREQVQAFFQHHGITDVKCNFADISGYPRGKLMPASSFAAGAELRIAQAIPMQAVTGDYSCAPIFPDSDPDVRLLPDYATLKLSPWASTAPVRYAAQGLKPAKALEYESYLREISAWERRFWLPQV